MKTTAVIMAGGKGERFWPKSRSTMPKQFLSLTHDGYTMIQLTAKRLLSTVSYEDMYVVTNKSYTDLVRQQLPDIPPENILAEPMARNTAPCIGLAAAAVRNKYDDAIMMVLPSDHLIKFEELYIDTMLQAIEVAKIDENLVTVGITPTYPETGYGYINFGRERGTVQHRGVYPVNRFVEKPDINTAKEYIASGQYLWNSGMFVWKLSTILKQFEMYLPDMYKGIKEIEEAYQTEKFESILDACYASFSKESIDYGIMERASNIYTIPGSFGWDDVGNWNAMQRINQMNENGNMVQGDVITIDTEQTIIIGGSRLIATVGVENMVIVDTDDAVLICSKDSTQDVKKVIDNLKICNRNDLI